MVMVIVGVLIAGVAVTALLLSGNKKTQRNNLNAKLQTFLEKANRAFIQSCTKKKVSDFEEFSDTKFLREMEGSIDKLNKYEFGLDRYRIVTWDKKQEDEERIKVIENIRHKNIEIGKGMEIPLGDDIDLVWNINKKGSDYKVEDIM